MISHAVILQFSRDNKICLLLVCIKVKHLFHLQGKSSRHTKDDCKRLFSYCNQSDGSSDTKIWETWMKIYIISYKYAKWNLFRKKAKESITFFTIMLKKYTNFTEIYTFKNKISVAVLSETMYNTQSYHNVLFAQLFCLQNHKALIYLAWKVSLTKLQSNTFNSSKAKTKTRLKQAISTF